MTCPCRMAGPTSSPPARGSSRLGSARTRLRGVVPARAGVFPVFAPAAPASMCRPRPRGGLPADGTLAKWSTTSSPPARGSSPLRGAPCSGLTGRSRRARGSSRLVVLARRVRNSSPPARGSSEFERGSTAGSPSSPPARGSSLLAAIGAICRWGRPRPRGGLPGQASCKARSPASSPPARGSSHVCGGLGRRRLVVPARAGVFPIPQSRPRTGCRRPRPRGGLPSCRRSAHHLEVRRPRPRGGLPYGPPANARARRSSPPARGSSAREALPDVFRAVVPARAGLPLAEHGSSPTAVSSPPARGSSGCGYVGVGGEVVVPARAGVFPMWLTRSALPPRRPRPRGGLPLRETAALDTCRRPRPRGGLPLRLPGARRQRGVVPARAGVFRGRSRSAGAARSRPRPRGGLPRQTTAFTTGSGSSPPARGSSQTPACERWCVRSRPRPRGGFRPTCRPTPSWSRRPRPRGGLPTRQRLLVKAG